MNIHSFTPTQLTILYHIHFFFAFYRVFVSRWIGSLAYLIDLFSSPLQIVECQCKSVNAVKCSTMWVSYCCCWIDCSAHSEATCNHSGAQHGQVIVMMCEWVWQQHWQVELGWAFKLWLIRAKSQKKAFQTQYGKRRRQSLIITWR